VQRNTVVKRPCLFQIIVIYLLDKRPRFTAIRNTDNIVSVSENKPDGSKLKNRTTTHSNLHFPSLQLQHGPSFHSSFRFRHVVSRKCAYCCNKNRFFRFLWPCIVSKLWSKRENQQDATVTCLFSTISQHVSGITMPIFRRTMRMLLHVVYCAGSAGCGW